MSFDEVVEQMLLTLTAAQRAKVAPHVAAITHYVKRQDKTIEHLAFRNTSPCFGQVPDPAKLFDA